MDFQGMAMAHVPAWGVGKYGQQPGVDRNGSVIVAQPCQHGGLEVAITRRAGRGDEQAVNLHQRRRAFRLAVEDQRVVESSCIKARRDDKSARHKPF